MSEANPFADLSRQVVEVVERQTEQTMIEAASSAVAEDARILGRTSMEYLLSVEADRLRDRLTWLHEHPKARHFFRRSAVQILTDRYRISTPMILEEETMYDSGHAFTPGYIFWKYKNSGSHWGDLCVDRAVRDNETGLERRSTVYRIAPRYDYEKKEWDGIRVSGEDFNQYADHCIQTIVQEYTETNPWVKGYLLCGLDWSADNRRPYAVSRETMYSGRLVADPEQDQENRDRLDEELFSQLDAGSGWLFPDAMFEKPLGLVHRAYAALGGRE